MSIVSCQPSSSLMHALLSLSSYVHSVKTPSSSTTGKHKHSIAETTVRHFVTSLANTLAAGHGASEEVNDPQPNIWDLKFLRRLLTLWTSDRLLKLDELIEQVRLYGPDYDKDICSPLPIAVFQQFDWRRGLPFRTAHITYPDSLSASSTPYTIATTDELE